MKTKNINYTFKVYKYFNIFNFKYQEVFRMSDSLYGEFFFGSKNIPQYFYKCFDINGETKDEILNIKYIEKFLAERISIDTNKKTNVLPRIPLYYFKCKELGIKKIELTEIISIND